MKLWVLLFKGNEMYTFFWCAAKPIVVLPDISLSSSEEWIYFVFVKLDLFGRGLKETLACGYIIMMVSAFITCSSWLARLPIVAWMSEGAVEGGIYILSLSIIETIAIAGISELCVDRGDTGEMARQRKRRVLLVEYRAERSWLDYY